MKALIGHRTIWVLTVFLGIALTGCTDTSITPMVGYWRGEFIGEPTDPEVRMRPEWKYKGYLQLYATGKKFKLHIESQAQVVDAEGTWTHKGNKINVTASKVTFDDRGGRMLQKPGLNPVDPEKVREAISRTLVFSFSDNPQTLEGLKITLGPLLGNFVFTKGQE